MCVLCPPVGSWDSVPSPLLKTVGAQSKANGCDFDEFSTNIYCIYIYGQVRLKGLPKKFSIQSLY